MKPLNILFATVPVDGHFNPLTSLAVHLKNQGHDVRWYAGKGVEKKLEKLGIPRFPFEKAKEINQFNIDEFFPERAKMKPGVGKLKFDLKYFFVYRSPEYFEDIKKIKESFDFDLLICDSAFTGGPIVRGKLKVPTIAMGIVPLSASSKDLPPYGLGLAPDHSLGGKIKKAVFKFMAKNLLFKESKDEFNKILTSYGLPPHEELLFDLPVVSADLLLQSGVPGFEYKRSDLPSNVKFVGALTTHQDPSRKTNEASWMDKLKGKKVMLVSQGTFEPDHTKLIIPTLEAFKDSDHLVLVATGFHHTETLRKKYPQSNIIIEDYMDFNSVMPKCDVYVTNGGYGGVLMSIDNELPMVAAGVNEGKNEICTRVGYFKAGVDLKKEIPGPAEIKAGVEKILADASYKANIKKLNQEFRSYKTLELCEKYISEVTAKN